MRTRGNGLAPWFMINKLGYLSHTRKGADMCFSPSHKLLGSQLLSKLPQKFSLDMVGFFSLLFDFYFLCLIPHMMTQCKIEKGLMIGKYCFLLQSLGMCIR